MAGKLILTSPSTIKTSIKDALTEKFGANFVILYETTTELIFTCPPISDKVIRLQNSSSQLQMFFGDSWTSGTTLVNSRMFAYNPSTEVEVVAVLYDNALVIFTSTRVVAMGKMTNGKFIVLGLTASNSYSANNTSVNTTDNVDLKMIGLRGSFSTADNKIYRMPLIFHRNDGKVEINPDGSLATLSELACSSALGLYSIVVGSSYVLGPSNMYHSTAVHLVNNSLLSEFDPT